MKKELTNLRNAVETENDYMKAFAELREAHTDFEEFCKINNLFGEFNIFGAGKDELIAEIDRQLDTDTETPEPTSATSSNPNRIEKAIERLGDGEWEYHHPELAAEARAEVAKRNQASESSLKDALETIGIQAQSNQVSQIFSLDAEGKKQFADGILKKMMIGGEYTWESYFKEAPYLLSGVEGKQTLEAMKQIHQILVS